jgi:hypothetical protein
MTDPIPSHPTAESLIDLARAEDFTDEQFLDCFAEMQRERDLIERLKGPGAHLLEGPRGVGKSSLMKKAELELDDGFSLQRIMGVYVNFKASLLVESGSSELGYDPFLCWVTAKILDAFYKKARKLQFITSHDIDERYKRLFGVGTDWTASVLEDNIRDLQSLAMAASDDARSEILKKLSKAGLEQFVNVEMVAEFVKGIIEHSGLVRINFLFDEAAHTFDEQQQETFFQFFKLLHGGTIAVKAATYPGITSYGGNFEIGHDAIKLSISSTDENLEQSQAELRSHFRELLSKRLPNADFKELINRGEALDLLILLSHGNPRMFLQTVSKWVANKEYSKRSALAASNEFVSSELVSYHMGLKKRLPRFSAHIDLGMALLTAHLVPELQKKNEGKGPDPRIQTVYFTLDPMIPYKVTRALSLLEYSGYIFAKSVVKTAGRKQARRFALHLGVAANEKVFHSSLSRDPDIAIKRLSIADYREFYASDPRFEQLVSDYPSSATCPNNHVRQTDGAFCPICGQRFKVDKVIETLLNDPVGRLSLTEFLKSKLHNDFSANDIRSVLKLTPTKLQTAWMIGPVRARQIINAAEEYISG